MNIDILVKNGVPWPVEQIVDVLIDKDHNPSWIPVSLDEVKTDMVMAHFNIPDEGEDLEL